MMADNEFKPDWKIEPLEMWDEAKLAELRGGNVALEDAADQVEKLQDRVEDLQNMQADPENAEWGDVWVNKAEYEKLKAERDELLSNNRTLVEVAHSYEDDLAQAGKDYLALRDEADDWRQKYQFMVDNAANEKLDGYRDLGERAAQAEMERDEATSAHQAEINRHQSARIVWSLQLSKAQEWLSALQAQFDRYYDGDVPHEETDFDYEAWAHANPPDPDELRPASTRRQEEE
jgi:DNA repair exonuclease SbcCD ATPase subunit